MWCRYWHEDASWQQRPPIKVRGDDDAMLHCCGMQEGPVHDVQWTRAGDYFAVVAGFMPARTTLFSASCKAVFDLGSGPHNLVRWSPQVSACTPVQIACLAAMCLRMPC